MVHSGKLGSPNQISVPLMVGLCLSGGSDRIQTGPGTSVMEIASVST